MKSNAIVADQLFAAKATNKCIKKVGGLGVMPSIVGNNMSNAW